MPTIELHPLALTVGEVANPYFPASVTGSPPQWADGSDATYGTATGSRRLLGDGSWATSHGNVYADLESLTIDPARVTAIEARARASAQTSDPYETRGFIELATRSNTVYARFSNGGAEGDLWWLVPADGAVHEATSSRTNYAYTDALRDTAEVLAAGARVNVTVQSEFRAAEGDFSRTFYELTILVTYGAAGLPPLRQDLCRDDHRVWPVSSQQASLRRFGGYY